MEELVKEKKPTPSRYQKNKLIKRIFNKYPILKNKYFLDICGLGEMLTFLDNFGMKGEGIDLSTEACKIAIKRVSKNIQVKQGDFMKLEKKKYGLIIMLDVLEHIKDDGNFVKKTGSLLESGGYFLINVPAKMDLFGNQDIFFGHYRRYEKDEMTDLLKRNGFKIIEFWSYGAAFLGHIHSFLLKGKVKDDKNKNTLESGIKTSNFMKDIYPIVGKFYWIMNFQNLFLNTNLGSQYLILAKKIKDF